jgi:hypothetical protein
MKINKKDQIYHNLFNKKLNSLYNYNLKCRRIGTWKIVEKLGNLSYLAEYDHGNPNCIWLGHIMKAS